MKQEPEDEHPGTIKEKIDKMHEDMCKEGRMDSEHCAKFREKMEEHHDELETMHDEHIEQVKAEAASAEEAPAAAAPEASSAAVSTDSVTVESVVEHEPVIKRQEFPYKEPCPSATSAVAMLLLSFVFA